MRNETKPDWCAIEMTNGKEYYSRFTDELKALVEGRCESVSITLSDLCVAARGPAGTTVVLKNSELIQGYRNQRHLFVSSIQSITPLDSAGEWAKGLDAVEGGKDIEIVHRPEAEKPGSGIVLAQPGMPVG